MMQNDNVVYSFTGPMGVRIDIGQSIAFLVGIILFLNLSSSLVDGVVFVIMLVGSILLHELGHAWGCKVQGIPVKRILLHGGGGLCFPGRSGTAREQELIVAMGPIVNLAIWAIAGLAQSLIISQIARDPVGAITNQTIFTVLNYLSLLGWLNLMLFIFNLLPVQPMDGGKLLHLFLLRLTNAKAAVRIAGGIGLVASVLWIPAAVYFFISFGFILFFFPSIPLHYAMFQGRAAY